MAADCSRQSFSQPENELENEMSNTNDGRSPDTSTQDVQKLDEREMKGREGGTLQYPQTDLDFVRRRAERHGY